MQMQAQKIRNRQRFLKPKGPKLDTSVFLILKQYSYQDKAVLA